MNSTANDRLHHLLQRAGDMLSRMSDGEIERFDSMIEELQRAVTSEQTRRRINDLIPDFPPASDQVEPVNPGQVAQTLSGDLEPGVDETAVIQRVDDSDQVGWFDVDEITDS